MMDADVDHWQQEQMRLSAAVKQLARHEALLQRYERQRDAELQLVHDWFEDRSHGEVLEVARLRNEIEAWAVAHRTDANKSWVTPWGTVKTVATKGQTVIDNEAELLAWCDENGYLAKPPNPKPDLIAIRGHYGTVIDGRIVLVARQGDDCEPSMVPVTTLPGVHVDFGDGFNVHIAAGTVVLDDDDAEGVTW